MPARYVTYKVRRLSDRRPVLRRWALRAAVLTFAAVKVPAAAAEEASLVTIKEIRTFGNGITTPATILHYANFKVGDVLTQEELSRRLARTQDNLAKTLFFSRVRVFDLPRSDPSQAVVMIDVAEGTPLHLSADTRQVRLSRDNINGQALSIGGEFGLDREMLYYVQPWVFGSALQLETAAIYDNGSKTSVENDAGVEGEWFFHEDVGTQAGVGYRIGFRSLAGCDVFGEYVHYYNTRIKDAGLERLGVSGHASITGFKPYFIWDGRDSAVFPTRNWYLELEGELAPANVSDSEYYGGKADLRYYLSSTPRLVFATRLRLAAQTDGAPYLRRVDYHGGGGLRNPSCTRTVGTRGGLATGELRLNLGRSHVFDAWFETAWFADAGQTWDPGEKVAPTAIGWATGPAVRVHMRSPILFDWRAELNLIDEPAFYASASRSF